ncbi:UDP-2,3-diacylglucosamine diphosphatase [bacterium]|nr:UDP-2,3-diacylglucosamine diphosphatase [bacterium]
MSSSEKPTYFFSDVHLGAGDQKREKIKLEKMATLLELIIANNGRCFILGDLFDFWFEFYGGIPSGNNEALDILRSATQRGLEITIVGGNHDYWLGNRFISITGCTVLKRPYTGNIKGIRIYAGHGDGLAPSDWGYRNILKPILRFPINIFLFKLFPKKFGECLARFVSNGSKIYTKKRNLKFEAEYIEASEALADNGFDCIIVGHTHEPARKVSLDNSLYINLGDFFEQFTYAVLESGNFEIHKI